MVGYFFFSPSSSSFYFFSSFPFTPKHYNIRGVVINTINWQLVSICRQKEINVNHFLCCSLFSFSFFFFFCSSISSTFQHFTPVLLSLLSLFLLSWYLPATFRISSDSHVHWRKKKNRDNHHFFLKIHRDYKFEIEKTGIVIEFATNFRP